MHTDSLLEPRFKKRVPCELRVAGGRHPGIVLNLSRSGLFVQTALGATRGDTIRVDLNSGALDTVGIEGLVVWKKKIPPQMRGVQHGGFGVQIRSAGPAYFDLLEEVAAPSEALVRDDIRVVTPEEEIQSRFRARVRQYGKSRSKVIVVACDTVAQARARVLKDAGIGDWELLEIEEL